MNSQHNRKRIVTEYRVMGLLCCCFTVAFIFCVNSFKTARISTDIHIPVDAIIVPGGGSQRGGTPDSLPAYVLRRLDAALVYYQELRQSGHHGELVIIVLSQGTVHKPNYVNKLGWPVTESTSEALYLLRQSTAKGIALKSSDILRENLSFDTIGNAFFTRAIHCDVAGYRRLHIITSSFHMERTRAIFEFIFGCIPTFKPYILSFQSTPNEIDEIALAERVKRETESLKNFHVLLEETFLMELTKRAALHHDKTDVEELSNTFAPRNNIKMRDVHQFIFTAHRAYVTREGMVPGMDEGLGGDVHNAAAGGSKDALLGNSSTAETLSPALLSTY